MSSMIQFLKLKELWQMKSVHSAKQIIGLLMETEKMNNKFSQTDAIMPSEWVDPLL